MRVRLSAQSVHSELVHRIEEYSGQDLMACYQCGKCAAGCPAAFAMDMLPSQVIRYAQLGLVQPLLDSRTIWLCAACQTCYTRCPKGVDLSRIMEALREIVMLEKGSHINYDAIPCEDIMEWPQQVFISSFRKYTV
jgi:heterodisulfide reductase subunit C